MSQPKRTIAALTEPRAELAEQRRLRAQHGQPRLLPRPLQLRAAQQPQSIRQQERVRGVLPHHDHRQRPVQLPAAERPERGLLAIRADLDLFCIHRPALLFPDLAEASSLRAELVAGLDVLIVRELTGGIYFGEPRGITTNADGVREGHNTDRYNETEIRRIGRLAFEAAQKRSGRLCSVDKANVLEVTMLWRETMDALSTDYPDVELSHMYVDNAAMQLVREPKQFDVLVTGNLFGDILSDIAAMLTGSIGMLPSASLNAEAKGLYEPVHGSAPDIRLTDRADWQC